MITKTEIEGATIVTFEKITERERRLLNMIDELIYEDNRRYEENKQDVTKETNNEENKVIDIKSLFANYNKDKAKPKKYITKTERSASSSQIELPF